MSADVHYLYEERAIQSYLMQMEILDPHLLVHSYSVAFYTRLMARRLRFTKDHKRKLLISSLLHDLGMLGMDRKILDKRGKLTSEEWKLIKAHPVNTGKILAFMPCFREIIPIVRHHHERYDGTGYPDGLMGDDIPLMSRMIMIADTFEALTYDRPYRKALTTEEALEVIDGSKGTEFDPELVAFFVTFVEKSQHLLHQKWWKTPMVERRRYPRYEIVTRVDVRLPHRDGSVLAFRGNTEDVSSEGLTVALYEGETMTKLIQSLLSEGQSVQVALEPPPTGDRIRAEGTIKWLDIGPVAASPRYLRVGIFLKHMSNKDRVKWGHFVQNRAQMLREESPTV